MDGVDRFVARVRIWIRRHPAVKLLTPSGLVLVGVFAWSAAVHAVSPASADAKTPPVSQPLTSVAIGRLSSPKLQAPALPPPRARPNPALVRAAVDCFTFVAKQPQVIRD